ncbi:hypothetical protein QAD02_023316 [Eretmocerus hayati]|uniref:Uncharacterized protein n=1 Tax=Eretmocerus hayati TaxID=131215 RepID=A0ACC2PYU6_9HYME|nr:hypothetical protein QAD02_023316 [Eretmocerus hayati]
MEPIEYSETHANILNVAGVESNDEHDIDNGYEDISSEAEDLLHYQLDPIPSLLSDNGSEQRDTMRADGDDSFENFLNSLVEKDEMPTIQPGNLLPSTREEFGVQARDATETKRMQVTQAQVDNHVSVITSSIQIQSSRANTTTCANIGATVSATINLDEENGRDTFDQKSVLPTDRPSVICNIEHTSSSSHQKQIVNVEDTTGFVVPGIEPPLIILPDVQDRIPNSTIIQVMKDTKLLIRYTQALRGNPDLNDEFFSILKDLIHVKSKIMHILRNPEEILPEQSNDVLDFLFGFIESNVALKSQNHKYSPGLDGVDRTTGIIYHFHVQMIKKDYQSTK